MDGRGRGAPAELELIRDALRAAQEAVSRSLADRGREYLGTRGYFGDATLVVDRAAEEAVLSVVESRLPDAYVVTEEAGIREGGGPLVLLDPVDGSMNARRGIPNFSTAIAITRRAGRRYSDIVAAGVLDHATGDIIWGDAEGVYVGWRPASPSGAERLEDALVDFQSQTHLAGDAEVRGVADVMRRAKYPRILGSAALGIAYVAAGSADAFVAHYGGLRTFDCVPSMFLLESAGGYLAPIGVELDSVELDSGVRLRLLATGGRGLMEELIDVLGLGPEVRAGIRGGRASR
ncbi:MAG: inositol monophosphatase family protein [Conexivisphaera sp.]